MALKRRTSLCLQTSAAHILPSSLTSEACSCSRDIKEQCDRRKPNLFKSPFNVNLADLCLQIMIASRVLRVAPWKCRGDSSFSPLRTNCITSINPMQQRCFDKTHLVQLVLWLSG